MRNELWDTATVPSVNPLTPNDPYRGRTAPLTSKRCILYIYSKNKGTEYFKHGINSPFFFFKMQWKCMKQFGSHQTDFHGIWYLSIFRKKCREESSFIKFGQRITGTLYEDESTFLFISRS